MKFKFAILFFIAHIPTAHASMDGLNGSEGYALLAVLASAILARKIVRSLKMAWFSKLLTFIPVFLLLSGLGVYTVGYFYKRDVVQRELVTATRAAEFQTDPLKIAACSRDFPTLKTLLSTPLRDSTKINLGRIVIECSLSTDKSDPVVFGMLIPYLTVGQWAEISKDQLTSYPKYCEVLQSIHQTRNIEFLKLLVQAGRPLGCERVTDREPVWWYGLETVGRPRANVLDLQADQAQLLKWLEFLEMNGVKLGEKFKIDHARGHEVNDTMLSSVIRRSSAAIILLALNAGCDPHFSSKGHGPIYYWQERIGLQKTGSNASYTVQLTNAEIDLINAKMENFRSQN